MRAADTASANHSSGSVVGWPKFGGESVKLPTKKRRGAAPVLAPLVALAALATRVALVGVAGGALGGSQARRSKMGASKPRAASRAHTLDLVASQRSGRMSVRPQRATELARVAAPYGFIRS